jgi:hypothetical protein
LISSELNIFHFNYYFFNRDWTDGSFIHRLLNLSVPMIRICLIRIFILSILFSLQFAELKSQTRDDNIKLNYFENIPPEVDGCSGLYTYDSVSLKKKKYIIVTDLSEMALVNVNGSQIQLKYVGNGAIAGDNSQVKKIFLTVYKGKTLEVILYTRPERKAGKSREETETWRDKGTMELIMGERHIKIRIHGVSGC